ncbi:MAG: glycosyltransferase [Planctomycetota bacterium]
MKILYHHRTKSRDGQFVHISEMQAAFARAEHPLHEVAPGSGGDAVDFGSEAKGLSLMSRVVPDALREVMEWGYNAVSYTALRNAVHEFSPDFIYERYALGNVAGVLTAKRFGLPLLLEVNAPLAWERNQFGGLTFPRAAQRLETWILNQADRILAVTEVLKAMLVDAGADADRVDVIHNGIDPARFNRGHSTEKAKKALGLQDRVVLGFTGFCRDWHGLDRVVRLLAEDDAALRDAHLLIVGDGPACPGLRELAVELGVDDRLTITGIVQREDLIPNIAAFDVALQPDVTAYASPLKLFEYMALAKAIVAPDVPNIRELVAHEQSAILFELSEERGFADAIRGVLADPELRTRVGGGAADVIEQTPYTWDHNAHRVVEIARSL